MCFLICVNSLEKARSVKKIILPVLPHDKKPSQIHAYVDGMACLTITCGCNVVGVHILLATCNQRRNEGLFLCICQDTQSQLYHEVDVAVFIAEILHELLKSTFLSTNLKKKNNKRGEN